MIQTYIQYDTEYTYIYIKYDKKTPLLRIVKPLTWYQYLLWYLVGTKHTLREKILGIRLGYVSQSQKGV